MKAEYTCSNCGLLFDIRFDEPEDTEALLEEGVNCPVCDETGLLPRLIS